MKRVRMSMVAVAAMVVVEGVYPAGDKAVPAVEAVEG